jgi:hypothetical protein
MFVAANEGKTKILQIALGRATANDLILALYKNDYTPVTSSTKASFTESTGEGYANITLAKSGWTFVNSLDVTTASYAERTFTYTGAEVIYGYYVYDSVDNILIGAERFPGGAHSISSDGAQQKITPNITLT